MKPGGFGKQYGVKFGLDLPQIQSVGQALVRQASEVVNALDTTDAFTPGNIQRDNVAAVLDTFTIQKFAGPLPPGGDIYWFEDIEPTDHVLVINDVVTVQDTPPQEAVFPSAPLTSGVAYQPILDLGLVRATYTSLARFYIARGHTDGTAIQPYRFELGSGWENPRWGEIQRPSAETTSVVNPVFEGNLVDKRISLDKANPHTLVIRCLGPSNPSTNITEVLIFARILFSPIAAEIGSEIAFACAAFPSWFHATDQNFVLRVVLPL